MRLKAGSEKKGGRKSASFAQPQLLPAVEALLERDTAGSPVDENIRWTNRPVAGLAAELQDQGFQVGVDALRRILFDELGLARRQALKEEAACDYEHRDAQFRHIAQLRAEYERHAWPVLSVDTKKKEILGNFHPPGRAITDGRLRVQDHDFVSAEDRLVPYGVYDTLCKRGLPVFGARRRYQRVGVRRDPAVVAADGTTAALGCSAALVALRLRRQQRTSPTTI